MRPPAADRLEDSRWEALSGHWGPSHSASGRHRVPEPVGWVPEFVDPLDPRAAPKQRNRARLLAAEDHDAVPEPAPESRLEDPAEGAEDPASEQTPSDAADLDSVPSGVRRLRSGRWGRVAEKWVPEPIRDARVDPGRRGALLLTVVAAIAAVLAAVGVWRDRPEPRPIQPVELAPANGAPVVIATDGSGYASPSAAVSHAAATARATPGNPARTADATTAASSSPPATSAPAQILVSVTGLVRHPGVVRLAPDARVVDAIEAAGGLRPEADQTGLNLAARVSDGDSIVVGPIGSEPPGHHPADPAPGTPSVAAGSGSQPGGAGGPTDDAAKVNLNIADQSALETLPGVGPATAERILEWRQRNGAFASVDQLQEIEGIGPARFAALAPLVTV